MRAFVYSATDDTEVMGVEDLPVPTDGEVRVGVEWSSMNFKDGLVAQPRSRVRRVERLVLGVEAAGHVIHSDSDQFSVGDEVLCYGGMIGVGRDGGFAEEIAVPARYVTKIPTSFVFHARQAMIFGLAGYTAMDSIMQLERNGLEPGGGEVLVTGATGSVGSLAVSLLARRGYRVVASSGSAQHVAWLESLGAERVIGRDEIADKPERVLGTERWAGAVDCVGGATLNEILRSLRYDAAVAASGLVASAQLETTVYPFITRNVKLLGVDSVETTPQRREEVWSQIAECASASDESLVERTLDLDQVGEGLAAMRASSTRGRWLVRPATR